MRVGIIGSREYLGRFWVEKLVDNLPKDTIVVSGGARGVDSWAADRHIKNTGTADSVKIYPPVVKTKYGGKGVFARAAYARNQAIVDDSDCLIVFWDGVSMGTYDTYQRAIVRAGRCPDKEACHYNHAPPGFFVILMAQNDTALATAIAKINEGLINGNM